MGKLELDLPNYVVAKLKKGVRKKESGPYYLYYWQPKSDLRQAGFKSVPLGRDLGKAIDKAKSLNEELKRWRSGGNPDPGLPPKLRGTIPYLIDLYQDSEDYRDKAPKRALAMIAVLKFCADGRRGLDTPKLPRSPDVVCESYTNLLDGPTASLAATPKAARSRGFARPEATVLVQPSNCPTRMP
jgi:hypothetical protein